MPAVSIGTVSVAPGRGPARGGRAALFLVCPRCGLSIGPSARSPAIAHCPRCDARALIRVELFRSALPAAELYSEGSAPNGHPNGAVLDATASRPVAASERLGLRGGVGMGRRGE